MSGDIVEFVDVMKYELGDSLKGVCLYSLIDGQSLFDVSFIGADACKLSEWISIVNRDIEYLISNSELASNMELMRIKLKSGRNIYLYPILKGHIMLAMSIVPDIPMTSIYEMFERHKDKIEQIARLLR